MTARSSPGCMTFPEKAPGWTLERLAKEGFREDILAAVDAMTKRVGEDYFDFVRRCHLPSPGTAREARRPP